MLKLPSLEVLVKFPVSSTETCTLARGSPLTTLETLPLISADSTSRLEMTTTAAQRINIAVSGVQLKPLLYCSGSDRFKGSGARLSWMQDRPGSLPLAHIRKP